MFNTLKKKYGKYFTFSGTTNGTDYFIRGLVGGLLFVIPFAILLGVGTFLSTSGSPIAGLVLILLSLGLLVPYMWFALATSWKRINAFWPNHTTKILIAVFAASFLTQPLDPQYGFNESYLLWALVLLPQLIFSFYILFANSNVKKHIG